jgi:hypothetical protein
VRGTTDKKARTVVGLFHDLDGVAHGESKIVRLLNARAARTLSNPR